MIGRLTFIAALLMAPLASAQVPAPPPADDSGATAAARETADRLIREGDASAFFVNKTDAGVPTVLHVPSGMICRFSGSASERIVIFPTQNDRVPRGDDVGCLARDDELKIDTTSYATRYRPMPSEDAALRDAVNAIRNRWPDAAPFTGDLAIASVGERAAPKTAAFRITTPEGPMLTMALVAHSGEWAYKVRATGPIDDAMMVSLYAGLIMANIQTGDE